MGPPRCGPGVPWPVHPSRRLDPFTFTRIVFELIGALVVLWTAAAILKSYPRGAWSVAIFAVGGLLLGGGPFHGATTIRTSRTLGTASKAFRGTPLTTEARPTLETLSE